MQEILNFLTTSNALKKGTTFQHKCCRKSKRKFFPLLFFSSLYCKKNSVFLLSIIRSIACSQRAQAIFICAFCTINFLDFYFVCVCVKKNVIMFVHFICGECNNNNGGTMAWKYKRINIKFIEFNHFNQFLSHFVQLQFVFCDIQCGIYYAVKWGDFYKA